jgi:hypothetical protein
MSSLIKACLILAYIIPGIALAQARGGGGASGGSEWYFEETFFPVYVNKTDTTSVTTAPGVAAETGLGYDFRTTIGYTFFGQALLGLTYDMYHLTTKQSAVSGGEDGRNETTARTEFGPTVGYVNGGWRVLMTMFMSGSKQVDTKYTDAAGVVTGDTTFKNTGISGFQLTTGYAFEMFSNTQVGPTLVYRSVSYSKQSKTNRLLPIENYDSTSLYTKNTDTSLSAMISVVVRF